MSANQVLEEIVIKKGRVTSMKFKYNNVYYKAAITPSQIDVSSERGGICVYNRTSEEIQWYYEHCCGLSGFGLHWSDTCPACKTKGGTTSDPTEIWLRYESQNINFPRLIENLNNYCADLEHMIRNTSIELPKAVTRLKHSIEQLKAKIKKGNKERDETK